MFGIDLIWLGVSGAAAAYSYIKSRQFVRNKLRFVDAVQNPAVPLVAGIGTAFVASAVALVPFMPIITVGTGLLVGLAVGTGVLHGSRDVKRLPSG
jgi:hypothetical protein